MMMGERWVQSFRQEGIYMFCMKEFPKTNQQRKIRETAHGDARHLRHRGRSG